MRNSESISALGEFGLIDRIRDLVGDTSAVVGIGDDAAVLDGTGEKYLLITTDTLVEGVHFLSGAAPGDLGRRALDVNLSDIAAMAGTPTAAVVSLTISPQTPIEFVEDLYRGLLEEAERYGVAIVGGNITRTSGPAVISVCQLGNVARDQVSLRSGAQIGDALVVTGVLGRDAAERMSAEARGQPSLRRLEPRLDIGQALGRDHIAHAMLDISDGLAADLTHLAEASEVGAVVYADAVPVAVQARKWSEDRGSDPLELALYGGEDYELLAAVPLDRVEEAVQAASPVPLTVVGTILAPEHGVLIENLGGGRRELPPGGWRHF